MSVVPSLRWIPVNGKEYLNNAGYTHEELATIADWKNASPEQKEAVWDRRGTGGLYTKVDYDRPPSILVKCELLVRLSNGVDEWRTVAAPSMGEAMAVAHCMNDVAEVLESRFFSTEEKLTGNLRAMGGIKGMVCYVHVRLADVERSLVWREVQANSLDAAIKVAEQMEDVEVCLEASVVPGGVVT